LPTASGFAAKKFEAAPADTRPLRKLDLPKSKQ